MANFLIWKLFEGLKNDGRRPVAPRVGHHQTGREKNSSVGTAQILRLLFPILISLLFGTSAARAQDEAAFYKGRQISIIVASTPGGGYDNYARLVGRHMGRHIPGNPTFAVSNMSGAGGNLAAGHLFSLPVKDGTAMALVLPGTITAGLYLNKEKLRHDPQKFVFLGSVNSEVDLCWGRSDSGVNGIGDLMMQDLVVGASADGGATREQPAMLNALLGTRFRIVSGYPGTREILMAIEKGEVSGVCGLSFSAMILQQPQWIDNGFIRMLSQNHLEGMPFANSRGVPKAIEFAKSAETRAVMELVYSQQAFGRPFVMAPGNPPGRVQILDRAFQATMSDPEFLADAARVKLDINPVFGEPLRVIAERIYATPDEVVHRAVEALGYNASK
jgi:hypothetical protein